MRAISFAVVGAQTSGSGTAMIAGYNTDVEHDGVIYHVQTEDRGPRMAVIESLVYVGGEVLGGKRSPYDDLVAAGFDGAILAERLQRQHKLICWAVRAGRIEDLRRLNRREAKGTTAPREEPSSAETVTLSELAPAPADLTLARELRDTESEPERASVPSVAAPALASTPGLKKWAAAAVVLLVLVVLVFLLFRGVKRGRRVQTPVATEAASNALVGSSPPAAESAAGSIESNTGSIESSSGSIESNNGPTANQSVSRSKRAGARTRTRSEESEMFGASSGPVTPSKPANTEPPDLATTAPAESPPPPLKAKTTAPANLNANAQEMRELRSNQKEKKGLLRKFKKIGKVFKH